MGEDHDNLIVCKFGGTSLASADQFHKVAEILESDPRRRIAIVSAPGKGNDGEPKVTDLLIRCAGAHLKEAPILFQAVSERFISIADGLNLRAATLRRLRDLCQKLDSRLHGNDQPPRDEIVSWGEWLSARLLADFLGWEFVDAKDLIRFTQDGAFDKRSTYGRLREAIRTGERYVIPGFYGSLPDGSIKTFDRGGSDITGGIAAAALEAALYENWTDVSGIFHADPRIVPRARVIQRMTYSQVRELAYMGASVLHHEAMQPCRERGIPIRICNTDRPEDAGTMIVAESSDGTPMIGIAGKAGFTVVTVARSLMNDQVGVGRRVLAVFEQNDIPYEHTPTSIDAISVVVATEAIDGAREDVLAQIRKELAPDSLAREDGIGLIAVVGDAGWANAQRLAQALWALWSRDVPPRLMSYGASRQSLILGVDSRELDTTIQALATAFFAS